MLHRLSMMPASKSGRYKHPQYQTEDETYKQADKKQFGEWREHNAPPESAKWYSEKK